MRDAMTRMSKLLAVMSLALVTAQQPASAEGGDWSGEAGLEARLFLNDPVDPRQHEESASIYLQPEWYKDFDDGDQRLVFSPYLRLDSGDAERSHGDLREFYWRKSFDDADLYVGLRKIFWGVTESQHLVDIINQSDFVDNLDAEDKLGQPMVSATFLRDWGTVDLYVMPYFRERTFQGIEGRLRFPIPVAEDLARYESPDGQNHIDTAVRWSHYFGDYDIGLSHFHGTNRTPQFQLGVSGGQPVLVPVYEIIDQTGLDLQATKGSWLWKLEMISRDTPRGRMTAATGGFEYTFWGVRDGWADVGVLVEYLFDDRGEVLEAPFQNDVFVGARLAVNDVAGSELLAGAIIDADTQSRFITIEGSRRLNNDWRMSLEARLFGNLSPADPLFGLRQDDYIEIGITRFW